MPRRQFDPDEALARARDVFWAKGYAATSAQDLVEAMGINRASLYDTFGSKRQLYEQALELYLQRDRAKLVEALGEDPPLIAVLGRLLRRYADQIVGDPHRRGCFLVNACAELPPDDPLLAARLTHELDTQQQILEGAFAAARDRGERLAPQGPAALAVFLVGAVQGLRILGKATGDRDRLELMIATTLAALEA